MAKLIAKLSQISHINSKIIKKNSAFINKLVKKKMLMQNFSRIFFIINYK